LVDFGADCPNGVELAAALAGEHTHSVCKRYFLDERQTSGINKVLSLRSSIPIHLKWIDPLLDVKARIVSVHPMPHESSVTEQILADDCPVLLVDGSVLVIEVHPALHIAGRPRLNAVALGSHYWRRCLRFLRK